MMETMKRLEKGRTDTASVLLTAQAAGAERPGARSTMPPYNWQRRAKMIRNDKPVPRATQKAVFHEAASACPFCGDMTLAALYMIPETLGLY